LRRFFFFLVPAASATSAASPSTSSSASSATGATQQGSSTSQSKLDAPAKSAGSESEGDWTEQLDALVNSFLNEIEEDTLVALCLVCLVVIILQLRNRELMRQQMLQQAQPHEHQE